MDPHAAVPGRRTVLAAAGAALGAVAFGATAAAARPVHRHRVLPRDLTPRQRAGQRVVYSYPGLTPPQSLLDAISAGQAAGVIFFGENVSDTGQIASVVDQLVQANAASPVRAPLLLMTDQEGGIVRRLPGEPTLSEKQVGEADDPVATATQAGRGAGATLKGVGMNVNLSPVLDVFREAGDFIDQYGRSYSSDPARVAALGKAFVTAQQKTGVAATAKHFPGLGAAAAGENTDEGPVTIGTSLAELRKTDQQPYVSALAAKVQLVMCSWAVYPTLDPDHPAGLSSTVVQQELRDRLGFTGVTITDALEARSLDASWSTARRAVLAAGAGMDLVLCSARDVGQGQDAVDGLVDALADGTLASKAFDAAVQRVADLRAGL